eukprot:2851125-Ditylum_brightwellii.AAC.1
MAHIITASCTLWKKSPHFASAAEQTTFLSARHSTRMGADSIYVVNVVVFVVEDVGTCSGLLIYTQA